MNQREYEKLTEYQLIGCRVRANDEIGNGWGKVPAGTVFVITGKGGGLQMTSEKCPTCGIQLHVSRVRPEKVTLMDLPKTRAQVAEERAKRGGGRGW